MNLRRSVDKTSNNMSAEFSRPIHRGELEESSLSIELVATEGECRLLAERFEQQSISDLRAFLTLAWLDRGRILSISGRFGAEVLQTCIVSLEPLGAVVDEEVNLVFARDVQGLIDIDDLKDAEPLEGETIDLGEIIAGEFSLALDPYPRREDIDLAKIDLGPSVSLLDGEEAEKRLERRNPFDALAQFKSKS